ncbi:MAG: UDP-3-O-(3-hydroxymyristoyl)glucosamine N-acyltransferase [Planctomycetota bacterium]
MARTVQEIAAHLGGTLEGDGSLLVQGLSGLQDAGPDELSFVADPRYAALAERSRAGALLVTGSFPAGDRALIRVAEPERAMDRLVEWFRPAGPTPSGEVDSRAVVCEGARLGESVTVMAGAFVGRGAELGARTVLHPGVYVGAGAKIGQDCVLHPNVVVGERVVLGQRVVIHPGSVIGAEGFGYRPGPRGLEKQEQIGSVRILDDVEIGALVSIDRARFGWTVIGAGTKIDNLVQVAHNVHVGSNTVIAAQTGISGSTTVGNGCVIGGQAGIVGHIRIGDNSIIAARAGISKDVPDGSVLYGYVARNHLDKKREEAALRRLPKLLRRVRELESRLDALHEKDGDSSETETAC